MSERIGAFETRAADQHVDGVMADIARYAAPQQLDRPFSAIVRENAGSTEFEKTLALMSVQQGLDVIFVGRIEAAFIFARDIAAKQTISTDNPRLDLAKTIARIIVDHYEMIAKLVELIRIAARERGLRVGDGAALFEKHLEAKLLRLSQLALGRCKTHFERAHPTERPLKSATPY